MLNALTCGMIRARLLDGTVRGLTLPAVYAALAKDAIAAFPGLRAHQRHAWHAFLAQLGVIACHNSGRSTPPEDDRVWAALLRSLTPDSRNDEPWCLVVEDPTLPAFLQCPAPDGLAEYKSRVTAPDDLDLLVTAKNHDVKQTVMTEATHDDWIFALVNLQTMAGFQGRGNYGIARMNGGFSSRPCLGLAPAVGGLGAHLYHDMRGMLERRPQMRSEFPDYFDFKKGVDLLWLVSWSGSDSLDLRHLDPYFIEVCRRVRLLQMPCGRLSARTANSKKARVAAKHAKGVLGDYWTPWKRKDVSALSVSGSSFRYDRLVDLLLKGADYGLPPAMRVPRGSGSWQLVARGVAGERGKTEGYYERTDIAFGRRTAPLLGRPAESRRLAEVATAQLEEVKEVSGAMKFGIAVAASGGKPADQLGQADRRLATPYARRLDSVVDGLFFDALEQRFQAGDEQSRAHCRCCFVRNLIREAERLLQEAADSVPCPAILRHRARARSISAFWGKLRQPSGLFSDQSEIFTNKQAARTSGKEDPDAGHHAARSNVQ